MKALLRCDEDNRIYVSDAEFEMFKNLFKIISLLYEVEPEHFQTNLWTYFFSMFKRKS